MSEREIEVLKLLSLGMKNQEINKKRSAKVEISERKVESIYD